MIINILFKDFHNFFSVNDENLVIYKLQVVYPLIDKQFFTPITCLPVSEFICRPR